MKTITHLLLLLALAPLPSCSGDDDDDAWTLPDTLLGDDDDSAPSDDDDSTEEEDDSANDDDSSAGDDDDGTTAADDDDSTAVDDDDDTVSGCVMLDIAVPEEEWGHVPTGSEITYANNPPTSGPHYGTWARFEMFDLVVPRGHWVHNIEHGGVVFLYHPDADPMDIEKFKAAYLAIPPDPGCDYRRALLTPDPLLEADKPFAVVAAGRLLEGDCVDAEAIVPWVAEHVAQAPENICGHGSYTP